MSKDPAFGHYRTMTVCMQIVYTEKSVCVALKRGRCSCLVELEALGTCMKFLCFILEWPSHSMLTSEVSPPLTENRCNDRHPPPAHLVQTTRCILRWLRCRKFPRICALRRTPQLVRDGLILRTPKQSLPHPRLQQPSLSQPSLLLSLGRISLPK